MKFKATDRLLLKIRLEIALKLYLDLCLLFIYRELFTYRGELSPQEAAPALPENCSPGSSLYIAISYS
jgi:hypothetical protein